MPVAQASFLSPQFLSTYEGKRPDKAGVLFDVVYTRTYQRYLPELKRRERWHETVARVVNYNLSLHIGNITDLVKEAELLYDRIFNLEILPAGRTLWVGGTESAQRLGESQFNCLERNTEFLTKQGYKTFNDFQDGDKVDVLSRYGGWKEATVKNFGQDKLYEVVLRRGQRKKSFFATANHRWVVKRYLEKYDNDIKTTLDLKGGDYLPLIKRHNQNSVAPTKVCPIGIQHGLVFGDGTYVKDRNYTLIDLCDDSQQFIKYFSAGTVENKGSRGGVITDRHTLVCGLPSFWKQLPDITVNSEYLLGFLSGWFAADGHISGSNPVLHSNSKESLEWARSAFALLGIYTSETYVARKLNPFNGTESPLYGIRLYHEYLNENFFLKDTHLTAFKSKERKPEHTCWQVDSIVETNRVEDVWCVQEPEQECFVLSEGVLTKNCSFLTIDSLSSFSELFHLLLCGCGVGFRVLKDDIKDLPKLATDFSIDHMEYTPLPKAVRQEFTKVTSLDESNIHVIAIGDSREAWAEALSKYFDILATKQKPFIAFNYNNVRPEGERIVSFGGRAPGPGGLVEMFNSITHIIKSTNGHLGSVSCMDICNLIGKNVIVGGTRRSSQIALGDPDDAEFIDAKKDLWVTKTNLHRAMSNNSVLMTEKPSRQQIADIFKGIKNNGEPGVYNLYESRRRRPNAQGTNPCGEILLDSRQFCNLVTLNMRATSDLSRLVENIKLITRWCLRMTNITVSLPEWDYKQKRDRLLGISMTGIMDAFDHMGIEFDSPKAIKILNTLRYESNMEAKHYAIEMGIPQPILVTCLKPEGSLSQLPTVSSGLHRSYAPYYTRRIRVSSMDPVCHALKELGVPYETDQGKKERVVFSFPIKTDAKTASTDESAKRQFERYLTMMEHYVDHNASCTLTIGNDEWQEIEDLVHDNFDKIVGCAFLPKYTDAFPQMPYEQISEQQYLDAIKTFPCLDTIYDLVDKYEIEHNEYELDESDCKGGVCPVR